MSIRSTETTVTFRQPFALAALDGPQAAGTYRLVVEEEEIPGRPLAAFPRAAALLHVPAASVYGGVYQVVSLLPDELADALAADAA